MPPRKRLPREITSLRQPTLSAAQRSGLDLGVALFNASLYWHAHEAWERVWMGLEDDAEILLRGLIQLAAALHCRTESRGDGMRGNLAKALPKLRLAPPVFWGIDFAALSDRARMLERDPDLDVRIVVATGE